MQIEASGRLAVIADRALDGYAELARWTEAALRTRSRASAARARPVEVGAQAEPPGPSSWLEMLGAFPLLETLRGAALELDAAVGDDSPAIDRIAAMVRSRVRSLLGTGDPAGAGVPPRRPRSGSGGGTRGTAGAGASASRRRAPGGRRR